MSNFWILDNEIILDAYFSTYAKHPEGVDSKVWFGEKIEGDFYLNLNSEQNGCVLTDMISGYTTAPVVSTNFKILLEKYEKENLQIHPAKLLNRDGDLVSDQYWHINILNNIDVFDWKNSKYVIETWDDEKEELLEWKSNQIHEIPTEQRELLSIRQLQKLVIKEKLIPSNRHIFRVKGIETYIIVSDFFRKRVLEEEILGARFILLNEIDKI